MPRPHQPSAAELQHKINELQTKLLRANSELRLKVLYAERLEILVCQRNKRVDSLYGLLEQARRQNAKLEAEADHLAQLVANSGQTLLAADHDAANA